MANLILGRPCTCAALAAFCMLPALAGPSAKGGAGAISETGFDFSMTETAQHLPAGYFEKHVRDKDQHALWVAAYRQLQSELAPKRPLSDEELFRDHVDLSFPGLEATRRAFEGGDVAGARREFAAFLSRRFPQQSPVAQDPDALTGWQRKVVGWCEGFLTGKIGPLASSGEFYTLAPGERFSYATLDPVGLNNYDWNQLVVWTQPVGRYIEGYAATGEQAYLSEAERIVDDWYDEYAGQGLANQRLLTFDGEGRFRQGNLGHAAIEFTPWEHWALAQGRLSRLLELAPHIDQTSDPERLAIRMTKIAVEDLSLLALRLPHYWVNFASYIGNDTCRQVVPFAFLERAQEWFALGYEAQTRSYAADSFPDGSTNDFSESYQLAYLRCYQQTRAILDAHAEHDRFPVDRDAFARERENSFEWRLYTSMPDLSPHTFNDCPRSRGPQETADILRQLDWCGRDDLRWLATERREGTPPEHTSYPFRTHDPSWAGIYAMRSDWGPDAVYLAVDFGPFAFNDAHGHADYSSFNLFAYGSDLIVDPACGIYGQPVHRLVDKAPQTHNAIMIDGVGQEVASTPGRPSVFEEPIHSWVTNSVFDAAWGRYDFPGGRGHSRIVWSAKPDYFLIVDTLHGDGVHQVRQNFTLAPFLTPAVEDNAARTAEADSANILILPADARPAPEIVKGRTEPMHEGWVMWEDRKERTPTPAVVYDWEAEFPASVETVLYPTPGGTTADVEVTRTRSAPDSGAVLVTVTTPRGQDQFVITRSVGRHEFPDAGIGFEGRMAMVRRVDGEVTAVGLLGAAYLALPEATVLAAEPADASIAVADGEWIVGDGAGTITVTGRGER